MGYIGNKGSISVSMSIYQTNFCFICTHLTPGERDIDIVKRNADVDEIYKRTRFNSLSNAAVPRSIKDHEKVQDLDMWLIIWLGDLNYRFNLSYEETRDLISKSAWSKLLESDQLRPGVAFDGSTEGALNFPPTYK
ncbi:putative inositol-polyphosphate 5-phosphatase [Helianthus annuus]|nr:putative inositol-polyphosphate 5-phosphatase [Helianthus annuus]KAJ0531789.1 putative inositol-polyphosphate 5-phosphatase [Helianthus annuus]KAJ0881771.1 putative inositol-polyphosphate 5-phosphatase [Helianthus annuus]